MKEFFNCLKKIASDKELKSKFEASESVEEMYDQFKDVGYKGTYEEFEESLEKTVYDQLKNISDDLLSMVSGGTVNKTFLRSSAALLSALSLSTAVTPASNAAKYNQTIRPLQSISYNNSGKSEFNLKQAIKNNPKKFAGIVLASAATVVGGTAVVGIGGKVLYDLWKSSQKTTPDEQIIPPINPQDQHINPSQQEKIKEIFAQSLRERSNSNQNIPQNNGIPTPPPPPPSNGAPPPPPPVNNENAAPKKQQSNPAGEGGLLAQIRQGTKLKKTEQVDPEEASKKELYEKVSRLNPSQAPLAGLAADAMNVELGSANKKTKSQSPKPKVVKQVTPKSHYFKPEGLQLNITNYKDENYNAIFGMKKSSADSYDGKINNLCRSIFESRESYNTKQNPNLNDLVNTNISSIYNFLMKESGIPGCIQYLNDTKDQNEKIDLSSKLLTSLNSLKNYVHSKTPKEKQQELQKIDIIIDLIAGIINHRTFAVSGIINTRAPVEKGEYDELKDYLTKEKITLPYDKMNFTNEDKLGKFKEYLSLPDLGSLGRSEYMKTSKKIEEMTSDFKKYDPKVLKTPILNYLNSEIKKKMNDGLENFLLNEGLQNLDLTKINSGRDLINSINELLKNSGANFSYDSLRSEFKSTNSRFTNNFFK